MSDVLNKMKSRRSIRKFKPDMVPQEILDQIIEAGLYAASGMGQQSPIIIQVTKKELRDEISKMNCEIGGWKEGFDPFYGAPAMLLFLQRRNVQLMYTMEALLWVTSCLPHMNLASEAAGFIVQKKSLNLTGAEIS